MKAKRPAAARGTDERRRTPRQPARGAQRPSADAPPRRGRPRPTDTAPVTRPQIKPVRPKNASQAKARAKARKAKAPKVVRPPLKQRLLARISEIDLNPRTLAARVPFVVLVIGSLGLGLGVTLWLSTDAAERSYQLGSARETNQALLQQKEALERDVLEAQAAPALAESARELGMIPSRDTAHLVQDPAGNWIVVGTPKPAEGVPPPPLNSPLPDETPAPPAQAAASRPAPQVVDPRELVVRMPERGQPTAQGAPTAPVPAPNSASCPTCGADTRQPARNQWPAARARTARPACRSACPSAGRTVTRAAARGTRRAGGAVRPGRRRCRCSSRRRDRPRRTRREPRHRSTRPKDPAGASGSGPVGPRASHKGADHRHRFGQPIFRFPAPGGQRRHLPRTHPRGVTVVQPPGAAGRGAARRGRQSAQGHRRRQGRARQHRRPQRRQAGIHHRGAGADVPAGQDPQAACRRECEDTQKRPILRRGCAISPRRWRRG